MGQRAKDFLSSFNRIEKWLREHLDNPSSMGFSELTRRVSRQKNSELAQFEDDLIQMAQLRNAIVHEQVADDFIIAEPNKWAVTRIQSIEKRLLSPQKVLPQFAKNVTGFEMDISIEKLLRIVAKKQFSQFPIYDSGVFQGLITVRGIGLWVAMESAQGTIKLEGKKASDLLNKNYKQSNYQFVSEDTNIFVIEKLFSEQTRLEAILITRNGDPNGNLLGIIRPRDLYTISEKDESNC